MRQCETMCYVWGKHSHSRNKSMKEVKSLSIRLVQVSPKWKWLKQVRIVHQVEVCIVHASFRVSACVLGALTLLLAALSIDLYMGVMFWCCVRCTGLFDWYVSSYLDCALVWGDKKLCHSLIVALFLCLVGWLFFCLLHEIYVKNIFL